MTVTEMRALGWAYGRLEKEMGRKYDVSGEKYQQACTYPIKGIAIAHKAAMNGGFINENLKKELADVFKNIDINDIKIEKRESVQPLEMQGVWQLAYARGKNGDAFQTLIYN